MLLAVIALFVGLQGSVTVPLFQAYSPSDVAVQYNSKHDDSKMENDR